MQTPTLFDVTGEIKRVSNYIAYPNHPHDDACFYGLPIFGNKDQIEKVRRETAIRVIKWSYMNHLGLSSNCSSFAEFMRSGKVINILGKPAFLVYDGNMYHYGGQHLNFGDTVAICYLREKEFNNGFFDSLPGLNYMHEFAEQRRRFASARNFLRAYAVPMKRRIYQKPYKKRDLVKIDNSIFVSDYHFLVCVGYKIHSKTGNLEPLFVCQRNRNVPLPKDDYKILLPPFGDIHLGFISSFILSGEDTPAFVFCSKPM
jgi:hypothetical protein